MRRSRPAAVAVATASKLETPRQALDLGVTSEQPKDPEPAPLPRPRAADHIREALQRWLEEEM